MLIGVWTRWHETSHKKEATSTDDQIAHSGVNPDQCPNMVAALECPIMRHKTKEMLWLSGKIVLWPTYRVAG